MGPKKTKNEKTKGSEICPLAFEKFFEKVLNYFRHSSYLERNSPSSLLISVKDLCVVLVADPAVKNAKRDGPSKKDEGSAARGQKESGG